MGMDFINFKTGDRFSLNWWAWGEIWDLARRYGWKPLGTEGPGEYGEDVVPPSWSYYYQKIEDWNGSYFSNGGQAVKSKDAQNMAGALRLALIEMQKSRESRHPEDSGTDADDSLPFDLVQQFVDFCQKGRFYLR